jgi:hypothetical protein
MTDTDNALCPHKKPPATCTLCKPRPKPPLPPHDVWVTEQEGDTTFHYRETCIEGVPHHQITWARAQFQGRTSCKVCRA